MKKLFVLLALFMLFVINPDPGLTQTSGGSETTHHPGAAADVPKESPATPSDESPTVDQAEENILMTMMPLMMGSKMMDMMKHQMSSKKMTMMAKMMAGMMGMANMGRSPKEVAPAGAKKHEMMMGKMRMMEMKPGRTMNTAFFDMSKLGLTQEQQVKIREISYEQLKKMQQLTSECDLLEIEASYLMSAEQVDEQRAKQIFGRLGEIKLETFLTGRRYLEAITEILTEEQKNRLEPSHG